VAGYACLAINLGNRRDERALQELGGNARGEGIRGSGQGGTVRGAGGERGVRNDVTPHTGVSGRKEKSATAGQRTPLKTTPHRPNV